MLWALDAESLEIEDVLRLPTPIDGVGQIVDGGVLYLLPTTMGNLSGWRPGGMLTVDTANMELTSHARDWPRLKLPFFYAAPSPRDR
mgnify:CR=1 FL=1